MRMPQNNRRGNGRKDSVQVPKNSFRLCSTVAATAENHAAVRTCVIFNPAARGEKARRFRKSLDEIGRTASLKLTACAGDAARLAAQAVAEDCDTIVAAGGDGTVNEVLNGLAGAAGGLEKSRLGVLPLGTVNVFARELALPSDLQRAWEVILGGQETRIDLPFVEFGTNGSQQRRFFAQMAGAGLDARAIELVHWPLKKKIGPLAYVAAGIQALASDPCIVHVTAGESSGCGGMVLIGNGRLYGGSFRVFPDADLRDGLLEVCVFPNVGWWTLARCSPQLLLRGTLPGPAVKMMRASTVRLESALPAPFEVDGELVGSLPATFSVQRSALRVIVP
jgi:diacylglycerol kinase (ATP)